MDDKSVEQQVDEEVKFVDENEPKPTREPMYRVVGSSKIAVSKHTGKTWHERYKAAEKRRNQKGLNEAWRQAIEYYRNDQASKRQHSDGSRINDTLDFISTEYACTENLVFANVSAAVPALYAKNPDVEITPPSQTDEEVIQQYKIYEKALDACLNKKTSPGVNLKPKIRKQITSAFMFNLGWLEVGWTTKEDSVESAYEELAAKSKELETAEPKDIERIEGELLAIEQRVSWLSPSGPFVRYKPTDSILRDPASIEEDLSDAGWCIGVEIWKTSLLNAQFGQRNAAGEVMSVYAPTMKLGEDGPSNDEMLYDFDLLGDGDTGSQDDEDTYKPKNLLDWYSDSTYVTFVARVWDKATRRVYLYDMRNWTWPIWVWDDPYQFDGFFPYVPLFFYTSPEGGESKGEVAYYLDQQDNINLAHTIRKYAMVWNATKIGYNSNVINEQTFKNLIQSRSMQGVAIKVDADTDLRKAIFPIELPAAQNLDLYNTAADIEAMTRLGSVSDILRGNQFKTNTTNTAIEEYQKVNQTRADEPLDQIEDCIGDIAQKLLFLMVTRMTPEDVIPLIGREAALTWKTLDVEEAKLMSAKIVGGSTQKPTSRNKRAASLEVAQILGQFASATPVAALLAIQVMRKSFDEVVIDDKMWQLLIASIENSMLSNVPETSNPATPNEMETSNGPEQPATV